MKKKIITLKIAKENSLEIEYLFWVGCAGSFDENAKPTTRKFATVLQKANINFGILGEEEKCTGDVAKRTGNEFLFQSMAFQNIATLDNYNVKKILTTCPHCFNTLKNEYSKLGRIYEVIFYTDFLLKLIKDKKIEIDNNKIKNQDITFHDPCYIGRGNGDYDTVRKLIKLSEGNLIEMKRSKEDSFCCGAGGGQIFKESEKGNIEISKERSLEVESTKVDKLIVSCPFCKIMLNDSLNKKIETLDILDVIL